MPNKIAIDIDGVCANLVADMIPEAWHRFGVKFRYDLVTVHDMTACTPLKSHQLHELFSDRKFMGSLLPIRGAVAATNKLADLGWEIHYLSSRSRHLEDMTGDWLAGHGFPQGDVAVGHFGKTRYLVENRIHTMVDDCLSHIMAAQEYLVFPLLYNQPWNQIILAQDSYIIRVKGWHQILDELARVTSDKEALPV